MTTTLTTDCYTKIKNWILEGEFIPGEKLKGEYLKSRLGTGLTPIREALSRLIHTNLVTFQDKIGFSVISLYESEVYDTIKSYAKIETLLFRESIENGDDEWEAGIMASLHKLSKVETGKSITYSTWEPRNDEFHDALIAGCQLEYLRKTRDDMVLFRKWYRSIFYKFVSKNKFIIASHSEHVHLAKLAINRKTDQACTNLYNHLTTDMYTLANKLINHGFIKKELN